MRVEDLLVYGKTYCHSDHVKLLLADLLNLNPLELLNHLEDIVEDEKIDLFKKEIKSLKEGKPLQYVIGNVNFYGNRFLVNENVLIPRFETEELVENTINYLNLLEKKDLKILDIGCGSGVIVDKKYDLIISNPPYIKDEEEIEDIVKNNEPNIALYAGKDGLDVYKKILKEVKYYMNDPCLIAFEIGMTQKEDLINLTNK